MKHMKKLIEVALPLDAINEASAREKSIRHGHPSTLHLWWARRPLAAARAVIFAQMVDDPSEYVDVLLSDPKKKRAATRELNARLAQREAQRVDVDDVATPEPTLADVLAELERDRLFDIIKQLVKWENTTDETVMVKARDEIWQSWRRTCSKNADHPCADELFNRHKLPVFHDVFAGGGALPLEAQRLGFEALASDLNPVAVLINKAMIEIPPRFRGLPPVNPISRASQGDIGMKWRGIQGLANDVIYYGKWMRLEAKKRIGKLYPKVTVTDTMASNCSDLNPYIGHQLTVVAWIWARTVKSPNPAFAGIHVPLISTFILSTKKGREAYIEPIIENGDYRFVVRSGTPIDPKSAARGTKIGHGANFACLMSRTPITAEYIKSEGKSGNLGARLIAIVADSGIGRVYLPPVQEHERAASLEQPDLTIDGSIPERLTGGSCFGYGFTKWPDLFSDRQLTAISTFSNLVAEAASKVKCDALEVGLHDKNVPLRNGGTGAVAYSEAVAVYLGLSTSRLCDRCSTICSWDISRASIRNTFSRQAIPVTWDYAEGNPLSDLAGSFARSIEWVSKSIGALPAHPNGIAYQANASSKSPPPPHPTTL